MLRDEAQKYLASRYPARRHAPVDGCGGAQWQEFADQGWLALSLPEDVDGLGCSFIETTLLSEELGRHLVLEPVATTTILSARIIDRCGSAEWRAALLPSIAAGRLRVALAHSEHAARYDLSSVRTTARAEGDCYILDGAKSLVFDAPSANKLLVSAILPGDDRYLVFVVDADAPGVTVSGFPLIDGSRAADVAFDAVRVAKAALLLSQERAAAVLEEAIDRFLLARVAEALGAMEAVMALTAEHLHNRSQFGQPLAKFQALQHRMAEMFIEVQATRSMLFRGLAYLEAPARERRAAVASSRIVCANAGRLVGGLGIQLHGGIGITDAHPIGHYFKRLIMLEKQYADIDAHLDQLAQASQA